MRTKTALDTALQGVELGSTKTHMRVEIDRSGAGTDWVEISDFEGSDFMRGAIHGEDIDGEGESLDLSCHLNLLRPEFSLAPGMTGSLLNSGGTLVQPYRPVRMFTTTVASNGDASEGTEKHVFSGRIMDHDISGRDNTIGITCRGKQGVPMDTVIEKEITYGSIAPTGSTPQLEDVIQSIVTKWLPGTELLYSETGSVATPFAVADATGLAIREYNQQRMLVWPAIQQLNAIIAYNLRYQFLESDVNDFVLMLTQPNRAASVADITLDPLLGQCSIVGDGHDIHRIRNHIVISYVENGQTRKSVFATDAASVTKYGRRYFEFAASSTDQLDTEAEAQTMADDSLSDLSEPLTVMSVQSPYLWYLQLGDMMAVGPDNVHTDTTTTHAVISRRNTIAQDGPAKTDVIISGSPNNGVAKHIKKFRIFPPRLQDMDRLTALSSLPGRLSNPSFASIRNV